MITPEIILTPIILISLGGVMVILLRKIPLLADLPRSESKPAGKSLTAAVMFGIKKGVALLPKNQKFDYELYLQKILSRIRILTLKTESKTSNWLERLRQKRNGHNDDKKTVKTGYWKELKKTRGGK